MSTITTYLLVAGAEDQEAVQNHSIIENWTLDVSSTREGEENQMADVTFVHESTIDDRDDLTEPAQMLSTAFPSATVLLCEVEERFDHIERVQTRMYRDGNDAGHIEHGFVFNVGSG